MVKSLIKKIAGPILMVAGLGGGVGGATYMANLNWKDKYPEPVTLQSRDFFTGDPIPGQTYI